jgi:hypothetical protein
MTRRPLGAFEEDEAFEDEVRAVVRAIYAADHPFQGSSYIEGRERDAVIVGDDVVVVVEATTGRSLEKAQKDGTKLKTAVEELARKHRFKAVKGFFITRDEPTPDQRRFIESLKAPIVAASLAQLRGMLIDSRDYLTLRSEHAFGSARNPANGSALDLDKYIAVSLLAMKRSGPASTLTVKDLVAKTQSGQTTLLLGDFGAGKSMTLREVHTKLAAAHLKDSSLPFPVTLNLREHQGQREPDEALRRHANKVGFDSPSRLVRAWRAGQVHLLLDGFDEIATTGWRGKAADLVQIRRGSVELLRKFADQTPPDVGLLISGRRHFFDSDSEMSSALGLSLRSAETVVTDEFTDAQVSEYLAAHGWAGGLPDWLPPHPLLLGYLASAGTLDSVKGEIAESPHVGWDMLLDRVCEREAQMEAGLDGATIRRVLERLATAARTRTDGIGPIYQHDLTVAFEQVTGYPPDEGSYVVLQRLPGLGVQDASEGSRFFIDRDLVDAARAGDLVRYVVKGGVDPNMEAIKGTAVGQGAIGVGVSVVLADRDGVVPAQVNSAASRLQKKGASDSLVLDLVRLGIELGSSKPTGFEFRDLIIDKFAFDDATDDLGGLIFRDCVIEVLDLTEYDGSSDLPYFVDCAFGVVAGAGGVNGLPQGHFTNCTYDEFDPSSRTTRGILAMPGLSPRQKVLVSILKKTYAQAGSGRREGALHRGLDDALKRHVPDVLALLIARNLLIRGKVSKNMVYFPIRGQSSRVRLILESGATSSDPILSECK